MNDIKITVSGFVGTDPTVREVNGGESLVTSFRLASTPRVRDRHTNLWRDQATSWFQVSCWRQLGVNVVESVGKGQRVVVHGRLSIREWTTPEGQPRTRAEIEADSVGFDLGFGRGTFEKVNWSQPRPVVGERELDELAELAELETRGLDVDALLGGKESEGDSDGESDGESLPSLGELVGQR
jgi:single-strand DNA-binding protein